MISPFLRTIVLAALAILGVTVTPGRMDAQHSVALSVARQSDVARSLGFRQTPEALARIASDTSTRPSRRASITGAAVGAVIGGLGTAAFILNATAYNCVTSGPPCPHKNYIVLHTVTITAGAGAGALLGARVGHWIGNRR